MGSRDVKTIPHALLVSTMYFEPPPRSLSSVFDPHLNDSVDVKPAGVEGTAINYVEYVILNEESFLLTMTWREGFFLSSKYRGCSNCCYSKASLGE